MTPSPPGTLLHDLRRVPALVWLMCAATFVNRAGSMVLAFLALYATQELGLSKPQASHILVVFGIASVAAALVGGKATDRFGPQRVMFAALAGAGSVLIAAAFANGYWSLLVAIALWAFLGDAYRPAAMSILGTHVAPSERKFAQSLHQVALNTGTMLGSGAGGYLFAWRPTSIFLVDGATSLLAAIVLAWMGARLASRARANGLATPSVDESPREAAPQVAAETPAWRDRRLMSLLVLLFCVWIVVFQILGALPLTLVEMRGFDKKEWGHLLALESLLTVLVAIPLARSTARWSHERTLALGAAMIGVGMGGYGWATTFGEACGLMICWSIGLILMLPAATALVSDIAPTHRQGAYAGLFAASFSTAFAAAPGVGIRALEELGPRWLFGACAALCAISSLLLLARAKKTNAAPLATASP